MTEQTKAELLAEKLDNDDVDYLVYERTLLDAATELRRLSAVEKERGALQAQVEALKADAARYRWLMGTGMELPRRRDSVYRE